MEVTMETKYYMLTDYPDLYKDCYWGRFTIKDKSNIEKIVANRNKFADELELKKYIGGERPNHSIPLFDHCELYRRKDGSYVYVTSPYTEGIDMAEDLGFQKFYDLYLDSATTYI